MDFFFWAIAASFIFVIGSCFGSFLNVVVYRLPEGLSLIHPPSRCPKCGHGLSARENIPVFGWITLLGKCRWCKTPIPVRYPLVEAFVGLLFVAVFFRFGLHLEAIAAAVLLFWLTSLALIDFDTFTLPNSLTQSGLVLGLIFQIMLGFQANSLTGAIQYFIGGIGAMVLGIWLLDIVGFLGTIALKQQAMGGGDPKLLAMIGVWLGWQNVILTIFLSCALGTAIIGTAMKLGKHGKKQHLPFGPFLAMGAMGSLFFGDRLIALYLDSFLGF
ncbi:type 4 prepilin peptidase 1 [[Leptolyngbya] sp. PCC 7376]|uniref:prepilin peptidase n=1 Tax=[Leptolyngbya] sp. PCC 7376 TaxID=111781 RepID=UPI00029EEDAD|nr:A24 family peptidase [[Leptolyngbya] sp. PCC 7376]AFY37005.1 type 4 prepilin peptidase 1 [[Leptolyngbya] sp. PCC 7376]